MKCERRSCIFSFSDFRLNVISILFFPIFSYISIVCRISCPPPSLSTMCAKNVDETKATWREIYSRTTHFLNVGAKNVLGKNLRLFKLFFLSFAHFHSFSKMTLVRTLQRSSFDDDFQRDDNFIKMIIFLFCTNSFFN